MLGQVRTTVCQGRLLMRKKLAQYLGLVGIAETQSGERETTSQDLQVNQLYASPSALQPKLTKCSVA